MISSPIVSLSSDYSKSCDLFSLFDTGIIPQAQQTVDSMLSGYKVFDILSTGIKVSEPDLNELQKISKDIEIAMKFISETLSEFW